MRSSPYCRSLGSRDASAEALAAQTALLLESRSGKTGFEFLPYVALLAQQHTYLTQLFWSGNWQYYIRRNPQGRVVLAGGLNPWGLRHTLTAGDTLALPDMLLGCVAGDLNAATQLMHRYLRRRRPDPEPSSLSSSTVGSPTRVSRP